MHGPHGLLDRRVGVGAMAVDEIDVVELQARKRSVDGLHQILAVEGVLFVGAIGEPPEELGRNDVRCTTPAELLEHVAHDVLGLSLGVDLGVIEEVDARIIGGSHAFARGIVTELRAVADPRAEGELAQLQARRAQPAVIHHDPFEGTTDDAVPGMDCIQTTLTGRRGRASYPRR